MTNKKDRDKPEIVENDPLQEIVPDKEEEKRKRDQEAVIRKNILEDPEVEKRVKEKKKDKKGPDKINKTRKCADLKYTRPQLHILPNQHHEGGRL